MDNTKFSAYLDALENGNSYYFRELSNSNIPKICAGVYTIWKDQELIYVGMSGRSMNAETIEQHRTANSRARGLFTRLKAHASGRRSGDQFCVYVGDRLVLPILTRDDVAEIVSGEISLDKLIKDYIHENLCFRFIETDSDKTAYELEKAIKNGVLKAGKPFLNPSIV